MEDSLIKWRKKCCGTVFSVLTLLFCVRARECVRGACSGTFSVPLPSFSGTKIYVAFFSLPIFFYFTLELPQYQRNSLQVLSPWKNSPLVEVRVACPLRVWVEAHLFLTSSYHGIMFPTMSSCHLRNASIILGWNAFRINGEDFFFSIFYKFNVLSILDL